MAAEKLTANSDNDLGNNNTIILRNWHNYTSAAIPKEIEGLPASRAAVEHGYATSSREGGAELAWEREVEEDRFRIVQAYI